MKINTIQTSNIFVDRCGNQNVVSLGKSILLTPKGHPVQHENKEFLSDLVSELMQYPLLELEGSALTGEILGNVSLYNLFSTLIDFVLADNAKEINFSQMLGTDALLQSVAGPEKVDQLASWDPQRRYLESLGVHNSFSLLSGGLNIEECEFWQYLCYDEASKSYIKQQTTEVNFEMLAEILEKEWLKLSSPERTTVITLTVIYNSIIAPLCFIHGGLKASEYANAVVASNCAHFVFGYEEDGVSPEDFHRNAYKEAFEVASICRNFISYFGSAHSIEVEIETLVKQGESDKLEFKETLSLDIKKQTKERYMELSALKTIAGFLNSRGGILLVGVSDDLKLPGMGREIDKLHKGNEDDFLKHFKNILKRSIGEDFYPFIEYQMLKIKDVFILQVHCQQSTRPCFLDGKDFYVRTNPATDKLEGPKLVKYVQSRFET